MPHWVKKFRNALDSKSRELTFRGQKMKLKMVEDVWRATQSSGADVRTSNLGCDHFELDTYKKMRMFLAAQITSQSTIQMIRQYCDLDNDANITTYEGMLELFDKVDRLVDICNAYDGNQITKVGKRRDVDKINHPTHRHIKELFEILRLFEEWKTECGGLNKKFVTWQTYEDLKWIVFGIASMGVLYMKEDGSVAMDQGNFGSDVCEHFYALIKGGNSNPDPMQARVGASVESSANATLEATMFRSKAKTNTKGACVDREAFTRELPTRNRHKRRKLV